MWPKGPTMGSEVGPCMVSAARVSGVASRREVPTTALDSLKLNSQAIVSLFTEDVAVNVVYTRSIRRRAL